jgi:hypothetical protein
MNDGGLGMEFVLALEKERKAAQMKRMKKERGDHVHFAPTLARTHTGDTKLDGAKWKSDNKFTTDWDEMRRVDFNRRVADPNRDIGKEGHLPSNIGGKRKSRKIRKSNKIFRKTRSKGGKATLPTNNNRRRSDLHDPALEYNEDGEELVGFDENFGFDEDDDGFDEDDDGVVDIQHDITVFKESLHQTIVNVCLSYAEQIADESSDYNSDSDSDSESEATIPVSQMNDDQLKNRAVCDELVYGEYNTGHIGLLQQYRDIGLIQRLTPADKEIIYTNSHDTISNWFRVQQETHGRATGNILQFYGYVVTDILRKIRIAFGLNLPPPPPLVPLPLPPRDVGGKRIKKQRRTRKSVKRKIKKSKRKKSVKRRKRITKKHKKII